MRSRNRAARHDSADASGRIGTVTLAIDDSEAGIAVAVSDTGPGLPTDMLHRLTEPYVSTRTKGTGLGLAIVRKIMEDHGGELRLKNDYTQEREIRGATITMAFPVTICAGGPARPVPADA